MTTIENGQPLSTHSSTEIPEEDQSRWYRQRTAADRILKCDQSDYSQILGLTEPIIKKDAYRAWDKLSDLLSPEGNPSDTQYVLAQKAHDCRAYLKSDEFRTDQFQGCGPRPSSMVSACQTIGATIKAHQCSVRYLNPTWSAATISLNAGRTWSLIP